MRCFRRQSAPEGGPKPLSQKSIFVSASVAPAGTEWLRGGGLNRRPFVEARNFPRAMQLRR